MTGIPPTPGGAQSTEEAADGTHAFPHAAIAAIHELAVAGNVQYPVIMPVPLTTDPQAPTAARKSPAEEEMDEEAQEWAIRIGNAPPPTWSTKRKATDDGQPDVNKRPRLQQ